MSNKTERSASLVSVLAAATLAAVMPWAAAQPPAASAPAVAAAVAPASAPLQSGPAVPSPTVNPGGTLPLVSSPAWIELTIDQRQALAPLERDWDRLDDARRRIWLEMVPGFVKLPDEERARLHERMRAWVALSPAERQRARINFQLAKQSLHASEREARWEAYQALPPEKRQELAEKAAARRRQQQTTRPACLPGANCAPDTLKAQPKSNRVPEAKRSQVKSVAPSLVQVKPGATTVLITQATSPVAPAPTPGLTKIVADPNLVDPNTLLPRRQPVVPAAAPSSAQ